MPTLSPLHEIELGTLESQPLIRTDAPTHPLEIHLRDTLASMWLLPRTRRRAAEAIGQLTRFHSLGEALLSAHTAEPLATLHHIGVINLHSGCGTAASGPQNAIELMVDYSPDWLIASARSDECFPDIRFDINARLFELTQIGVSIHGAKRSERPPLALALYRADSERWTQALLAAGADPTQKTQVIRNNGTRQYITCLQLASELKRTEASRLMADALLPEASGPLAEKDFADLMHLAIRADSAELFKRLLAHGQGHPEANLAKSVHQFGRQIGPNIGNELATLLAFEEMFDAMGRERLEGGQYLPLEAAARRRSLAAEVIALLGIHRMAESGDTDRIMALFRSLCAQIHVPRLTPEFTRKCIDRIDTCMAATASLRAIDTEALGALTQQYSNLWVNGDLPPVFQDREARARERLTGILQLTWGDHTGELLAPQRLDPQNPELESPSDALLRACDFTRSAAVQAKAVARALDDWKNMLRTGVLTDELKHRLSTTNRSRANTIFNAQLTTAIEHGKTTTASALLRAAAPNQLSLGVHIEDPLRVLSAIALLNRTPRAALVRSVCAMIREDPVGPMTPEQLRGEIDRIVSSIHHRTDHRSRTARFGWNCLAGAAMLAHVAVVSEFLIVARPATLRARHEAAASVFGETNARYFEDLERDDYEPGFGSDGMKTALYAQWKKMLAQGLINLGKINATAQPESDFAFAEYLQRMDNFDHDWARIPWTLVFSGLIDLALLLPMMIRDEFPNANPAVYLTQRQGRRSAAEYRQQLQRELAPLE